MHKCIKVAHYIESALAGDTPATVTLCMRQIAQGPMWVQCALPPNLSPEALATYLAKVHRAKKKAKARLNKERCSCYSGSSDSLLASASLQSPKDLSLFWRKLQTMEPMKPITRATTVVEGVTHTL
jgi:hypothetical protein